MNRNILVSNYKISGRDDLLDRENGVTPEIKAIIKDVYPRILNNEKNIDSKLEDLITKYPDVPQFKNYLSIYYTLRGKDKKSHMINLLTYKSHPKYLFGRLALANDYIDMKDLKKVPELMGEMFDLKSHYPERNEFHFGEVESYFVTAIRYFIGIQNIEAAESRLNLLKELNPRHQHLDTLQNQLTALKQSAGSDAVEKESNSDKEHEIASDPALSERFERNEPCPCGSGKKFKKCCGK